MNPAPHAYRRRRIVRARHGVSDILATILLVAIVVILAAVLFVLDGALTRGPGATPIGSAFAAGASSSAISCTAAGVPIVGCLAANDYVYSVGIAQSTVSFGSVLFEVKTPGGPIYRTTSEGGFNILNGGGQTNAAYNLSASGPLAVPSADNWVYFPGSGVTHTTPLTSVYTIVIDMGSLSPVGQGYEFLVAGSGSFSGTTSPVSLP
jgi:flagellin-like protein